MPIHLFEGDAPDGLQSTASHVVSWFFSPAFPAGLPSSAGLAAGCEGKAVIAADALYITFAAHNGPAYLSIDYETIVVHAMNRLDPAGPHLYCQLETSELLDAHGAVIASHETPPPAASASHGAGDNATSGADEASGADESAPEPYAPMTELTLRPSDPTELDDFFQNLSDVASQFPGAGDGSDEDQDAASDDAETAARESRADAFFRSAGGSAGVAAMDATQLATMMASFSGQPGGDGWVTADNVGRLGSEETELTEAANAHLATVFKGPSPFDRANRQPRSPQPDR
ncbi:hypothetical protein CXG81DRAFT_20674 [Caulochytrium protostelioides]|uniref:Regulator of volume decrease after cellular swelling-domain-containing protein n=1 Tax=Caulochytrium protostelioides TaxID=1555241 RepID=A0A4P9X285_9FUNG|nr:hypothetical protein CAUPRSCDRAFT_10672 [Caulochytrium protostelioides]RKO99223.1 hypothetical protein CXG81DRAFT_20674 [Caulochytrium protostelioides]|eukprot:RKO99223.1 hypothetical protein CXG81DRAFT_20674 [Caulochytrium protostelioides]